MQEREKNLKKKIFGVIVIILLLMATITSCQHTQIETAEEQRQNQIQLDYYFPEPWITQVNVSNIMYDQVIINGTQLFCQYGTPCLPIKTVSVLLPQKGEIQSITIDCKGNISLGQNYNIQLGTNFVTLNRFEKQNQSYYYNNSRRYPTTLYTNCGIHYFRGYSILIFNLHPIYYVSSSGELYYFHWMNVTITTSPTGTVNPFFRNLPEDEQQMKQMVDDYSRSNTYTSYNNNLPPSYLVDPTKMYKYVIITSNNLKNSQGTYTFQDFMNYKKARGITTTIMTVEDIYDAYTGIDKQDKIRNFIRDAYYYWETNYVLLGGDNESTGYGSVPARRLWVAITDQNGNELADYSKNIPADTYYACLDGAYNKDGDSKWGEPHDGENGSDVDLIAEIYIGRACIDNPTELSNFVMKNLAYENTADNYLDKVLMVGEWLGFGGYADWGGNFKNEIINGSQYLYTTAGIPDDEYLIDTLYDEEYQPNGWPNSLLIDDINDNVHIINHLGHSGYDHNMKLYPSDINLLTNEKYCFMYSQGCNSGGFDNPDGYDCIAEYLTVKTSHGAFAGIWNGRYGFEGDLEDVVDGPSQRHDRWFFDGIYNASQKNSVMRELGSANQYSKWKNLHLVDEKGLHPWELTLPRIYRWVCYELNLFGDPEIAIKSDHDLEATNIDLPRYVETGFSIPVKVSVWNRGLNDETNIEVNFIVNGIIVDTNNIDVSHNQATNITFSFTFSHGISYDLTIKVDIVDNEKVTSNNWLNRTVIGDCPPDKPQTPSGSSTLYKNKEGRFYTNTADSDDDQVYYWWDWGDGTDKEWLGPYTSGEGTRRTHTWKTNADYSIRVITKDECGALSIWSNSMLITVPFYSTGRAIKSSNNQILENQYLS